MGIVREELVKPEASRGVVFDGVVRTIPQAEGVGELLAGQGRRMDHVLFFDVPDQEILARIAKRRSLEGRSDDDPAAVERRLEAYREQTAPVLDWYEQRGGVTRIPATGRWRRSPGGSARRSGPEPAEAHGDPQVSPGNRLMAQAGAIVAGPWLWSAGWSHRESRPRTWMRRPRRSSGAIPARRPPSRACTASPRASAFPSTMKSCTESRVPERILREGNIVSIDVGVYLNGFHADSAATFPVGEIAPRRNDCWR